MPGIDGGTGLPSINELLQITEQFAATGGDSEAACEALACLVDTADDSSNEAALTKAIELAGVPARQAKPGGWAEIGTRVEASSFWLANRPNGTSCQWLCIGNAHPRPQVMQRGPTHEHLANGCVLVTLIQDRR